MTTDQHARVIQYYESTQGDYKRFWLSKRDWAIHFGYYDAHVRSHPESLLRMNAVLAQHAQIGMHDRVLDAGCGYGGSSLWLAEQIGCKVVGISVVPSQVQQAREIAHQRGLSHLVGFEAMDFCATTFPDSSFDVAWFLESAVHAQQKDAVITEAGRLLRPGGRLVIAEYMLREHLTQEEYQQFSAWLSGWAMPGLLEVDAYRHLLKHAGFRVEICQDITEYVRPSIEHLGKLRLPTLPWARVITWVGKGLSRLRLYSKDRLDNVEAGICMSKLLRQGMWRYVLLCAIKEQRSD
jgi:tocopherol O-methyltransferase